MIKEIHKTICICDCCKKEVNELKDCKIPMTYFYDREVKTSNRKIGLCDECNEKLKNVIREHFHKFRDVWCVGVEDDE